MQMAFLQWNPYLVLLQPANGKARGWSEDWGHLVNEDKCITVDADIAGQHRFIISGVATSVGLDRHKVLGSCSDSNLSFCHYNQPASKADFSLENLIALTSDDGFTTIYGVIFNHRRIREPNHA